MFRVAIGWGGAILTGSSLLSAEPTLPQTDKQAGSADDDPQSEADIRATSTSKPFSWSKVLQTAGPIQGEPVVSRASNPRTLSEARGSSSPQSQFQAADSAESRISSLKAPDRFRSEDSHQMTYTTYGRNALRRFVAYRPDTFQDEWTSSLAHSQNIRAERSSQVSSRHLFGMAEAMVKGAGESPEVSQRPILGESVVILNEMFQELAAVEHELEVRKGVFLDLFGEVRNDFEEFARNRSQRASGRLPEQDPADLSSFFASQGSDLPEKSEDVDLRMRVGLNGLVDPNRLKLSGRVECRWGTGPLRGSTLFLSGQLRPFAEAESNSSSSQKPRYSVFLGFKKSF